VNRRSCSGGLPPYESDTRVWSTGIHLRNPLIRNLAGPERARRRARLLRGVAPPGPVAAPRGPRRRVPSAPWKGPLHGPVALTAWRGLPSVRVRQCAGIAGSTACRM
jgi:hypothetical protein